MKIALVPPCSILLAVFNSNLCDKVIDTGLPAKDGKQTPTCCDSTKNCSLHWSEGTRPADGFLDLGRLGLVLEQGRSA